MKEYIVNDCGVVINANEHIIIKHKDQKWRGINPVEIKTAEKDGMWYCECDYNFKNCGIGKPLMFGHSPRYKTEKEAITEEIKKLTERLKDNIFYDKEMDGYVKELKEYIRNDEQLSFF